MLLHLKIKSGISWWSPKFLDQPDPTSCSEDQGGNFPVNQTCRQPSYPEWVLPHAVLEVVAVPQLSSYLQYMDASYGKNPILQSFRCFLLKILTWLYPNSTITPLKEGFGRINWFRCEILWNHSKKVGCYEVMEEDMSIFSDHLYGSHIDYMCWTRTLCQWVSLVSPQVTHIRER